MAQLERAREIRRKPKSPAVENEQRKINKYVMNEIEWATSTYIFGSVFLLAVHSLFLIHGASGNIHITYTNHPEIGFPLQNQNGFTI